MKQVVISDRNVVFKFAWCEIYPPSMFYWIRGKSVLLLAMEA